MRRDFGGTCWKPTPFWRGTQEIPPEELRPSANEANEEEAPGDGNVPVFRGGFGG